MKVIEEFNGLKVGQSVTWRYTYPGGYGRTVFVKAIVVKLNSKKCRIEATAIDRKNQEVRKQANATYSNIKESTLYQPSFIDKQISHG